MSGGIVRRGAVAAGALLAAGSVFGAAALHDSTSANRAADADTYPGQGRLDGTAPVPPGAVVVDDTAVTAVAAGLNAGSGSPVDWMPIAFPAAAAASNIAERAATDDRTGGDPGRTSPVANNPGGGGNGGGSTTPGDPDGSTAPDGGVRSGPIASTVEDVTEDLGDGVTEATDDVPVVRDAGRAVGTVVEGAGKATSGLLGTVGRTVAKVAEPVVEAPSLLRASASRLFASAPDESAQDSATTASAPRTVGDEDSFDDEQSSEESSSSVQDADESGPLVDVTEITRGLLGG